jgi:hypothetical protein
VARAHEWLRAGGCDSFNWNRKKGGVKVWRLLPRCRNPEPYLMADFLKILWQKIHYFVLHNWKFLVWWTLGMTLLKILDRHHWLG